MNASGLIGLHASGPGGRPKPPTLDDLQIRRSRPKLEDRNGLPRSPDFNNFIDAERQKYGKYFKFMELVGSPVLDHEAETTRLQPIVTTATRFYASEYVNAFAKRFRK